ncbi:MAG: hypothetical protein DMG40_14775 [Acidobacteria bacterium]|nr:MAG: hypothetical protein DMG40_14775 [Acidobacteriota bacterium]
MNRGAQPSASAERKKLSQETAYDLPVYSFEDLLGALASRARVTYVFKEKTEQKTADKTPVTFWQVPDPTPVQARAYELLRTFPVTGS